MTTSLVPVLFLAAISLNAGTPMTVRLLTNLPSPQPVGTPIGLAVHVDNPAKGMLVYRYSVRAGGGPLHVIRDFSQQRDFVWRPALYEHDAVVHVTVRSNETKETADDERPFRTASRIKDSSPVITPTANALIALFSAPPCAEDGKFRVAFQRVGTTALAYTPFQACHSFRSNNVYVAGMRADSDYRLRAEVAGGRDAVTGPWMAFHTSMLDGDFPPVSIAVPRGAASSTAESVLIFS